MAKTVEQKRIIWRGDLGHVPSTITTTPDGTWIRQGLDGAVFIGPLTCIDEVVDILLDHQHKVIESFPLEKEV